MMLVLQAAAGSSALRGKWSGGVGGELDQVAAAPWGGEEQGHTLPLHAAITFKHGKGVHP